MMLIFYLRLIEIMIKKTINYIFKLNKIFKLEAIFISIQRDVLLNYQHMRNSIKNLNNIIKFINMTDLNIENSIFIFLAKLSSIFEKITLKP